MNNEIQNTNENQIDQDQIDEHQIWNIVGNYFENNGFVKHQKDTFNECINNGLQRVINEEPNIHVTQQEGQEYTVQFGQIYISEPSVIEANREMRPIFPNDARQRDLSYTSAVHVDITETYNDGKNPPQTDRHSRIVIGRIPIMLRSEKCNLHNLTPAERIKYGECEWDQGGYFIIKGKERVLVGQLRGVYNQPIVLEQKSGDKYKYVCDIRSMSDQTGHSVLIQTKIEDNERTIVFSLPYIKEPVLVGIVFKSLGYTSDNDIRKLIGLYGPEARKYINYIIRDSFFIQTQEQALEYLGQYAIHIIKVEKQKEYAKQVVENELFPHMGISSTIKDKAFFLGYLVNKLLSTQMGMRLPDDRDNYTNKRVEMSGILVCDLFRTLFKRYCKTLEDSLLKKKQRPDILTLISRTNTISLGLNHSFATGNWGVPKNSYIRTGVSQVLSRLTFGATLSHLRRVVIPIGKEGKNADIRQVHSSQIFTVCPSECFDPDTPILLYNGKTIPAYKVKVGDVLIGDNGTGTAVRTTCCGTTNMYEVCSENNSFAKYTVTDNHILTLKVMKHRKIEKVGRKYKLHIFDFTNMCFNSQTFDTEEEAEEFSEANVRQNDVIDITIEKYNLLSEEVKENLYGFKSGCVNWNMKETLSDPYIMGSEFGYFIKNNFTVSNMKRFESNFMDGTFKEKYIVNHRETRLRLLAGIIDSVGVVKLYGKYVHVPIPENYEENPKNKELIEDLFFLIRSLGLSYATIPRDGNINLYINGLFLHKVPTLSKKMQNYADEKMVKRYINSLVTPISVVEKGIGSFVGWQLKGNGRFLLGDFTVVHNTPEGQSVGIVLNLSLLTDVSHRIPTVYVKDIIETHCKNIIFLNDFEDENSITKIFINGNFIGFSEDPDLFIDEIKNFKETGLLNKQISVVHDIVDEEIRIFSDEGRFIRPVFTVEGDKLKLKKDDGINWSELVDKNIIQYLDNSEIEQSVIAMTQDDLPKYPNDYCEIAPANILGVMASIIPFSDHSQCIFEDEPVYMHDGSVKMIKDVEVGDKVITFDPRSLRQTIASVSHTYHNMTNKKMYEIETYGGRKIKATFDHKFVTMNGWQELEDINQTDISNPSKNDLIAISLEPLPVANDKEYNMTKSLTETCVYYGLKNISHELPEFGKAEYVIMARLIGFCMFSSVINFKDGSIYTEINFEDNDSAETFCYDVSHFNVEPSRYDIYENKSVCLEFKNIFPVLLAMFYCGKTIPGWIIEGSDMIKREFIAGFHGKNSSHIGIRGENLMINMDNFVSSNEELIDEIVELHNSIGVSVGKILIGENSYSYQFENTHENFIKYFEIIGYRYNVHHQVTSGILVEYLRYCNKNVHDEKMSVDVWFNTVYTRNTTIFVPVLSKVEIEKTMIADITIDSSNQSFLCGDSFCVHNSPRNCYQCLDPEEFVMMGDRSMKKIKDIRVGDQVVTVDPETYEKDITTVTNQFVKPTEKKIITIYTVSGRSITCTEDHPILSPDGWQKAIDVEYVGIVSDDVDGEYSRVKDDASSEIISRDSMIFVPVDRKVERPNMMIADISVESENHSFITGDLFCVHNSSMGKQAMGIHALSHLIRADTITHVLTYPQRPLVGTIPSQFMGFNHMPSGINAIVAIACYTGLTHTVKPMSY